MTVPRAAVVNRKLQILQISEEMESLNNEYQHALKTSVPKLNVDIKRYSTACRKADNCVLLKTKKKENKNKKNKKRKKNKKILNI